MNDMSKLTSDIDVGMITPAPAKSSGSRAKLFTGFFVVIALAGGGYYAYDTLYAMADREDDLKIGVKSTAILFGRYDLAIISVLYASALTLLVVIGLIMSFKPLFYFGLLAAALSATPSTERFPMACSFLIDVP